MGRVDCGTTRFTAYRAKVRNPQLLAWLPFARLEDGMAAITSINVTSCAIITSIVFGVGLLAYAPVALAQDKPVAAQQPIQLQAWQKRRVDRLQLIEAALSDPSIVAKSFDHVLTNFEAHPLDQGPLENMDLLGYFYAPKEGIPRFRSIPSIPRAGLAGKIKNNTRNPKETG
jgi:hypothetical protein